MYRTYHKEYNHNEKIKVGDWDVDGGSFVRDVTFIQPLDAPVLVRKTIGKLRSLLCDNLLIQVSCTSLDRCPTSTCGAAPDADLSGSVHMPC